MARHVRIAVLAVVCGVAVNIAVAWGVTIYADPIFFVVGAQPADWEAFRRAYPAYDHERFALVRHTRGRYLFVRHISGVPAVRQFDDDQKPRRLVADNLLHAQAGWPLPALSGECHQAIDVHEASFSYMRGTRLHNDLARSMSWAMPLRGHMHGGRFVPLRPMWPGFLVNALLFASVVWLMIVIPGALRRHLRGRRGLCERCGYPVGRSAVCTECGRQHRGGGRQSRPSIRSTPVSNAQLFIAARRICGLFARGRGLRRISLVSTAMAVEGRAITGGIHAHRSSRAAV